MYRVNMLVFWMLSQVAWIIFITFVNNQTHMTMNVPGEFTFIIVLSSYLAAMVVFKVVFAAVHILKMKFQYNCCPKLKVERVNLHKEIRKLKKGQDHEDGLMDDDDNRAADEQSD